MVGGGEWGDLFPLCRAQIESSARRALTRTLITSSWDTLVIWHTGTYTAIRGREGTDRTYGGDTDTEGVTLLKRKGNFAKGAWSIETKGFIM